ncbi:MAG: Ig-like domain-containing protein [Bacteroidales bacterium]
MKKITQYIITPSVSILLLFTTSLFTVAQTVVNKQLYLSDVNALDRINPAASPVDNTTSSSVTLTKSQAVLGAASTNQYNGLGNNTPLTITGYQTPSGSNQMLIVAVGHDLSDDPNARVTSITYGVDTLRKLDSAFMISKVKVDLWYLLSPSVGTSDITINFLKVNSSGKLQIGAGVTLFTGVNLTAPFGAAVKNSGTTTSSSISVPSNVGDYILDIIASDSKPPVIGGSQTLVFSSSSNKTEIRASSLTGLATSTPMSWTFASTSFAHLGVAIKGNATETQFTQSPTFCSNFTIPAAQSYTIKTYAHITTGTMPATPAVKAELLINGITSIKLLTAPTWTLVSGSDGYFTWTGTLASPVTLTSGQYIALHVENDMTAVQFQLDYDSQTKPSLITLPTTTYINTTTSAVYNVAYSGGSIVTSSLLGATLYPRVVVTDPFGYADITGLDLRITDPNSNVTTVTASTATNTSCATTYQYTWLPTIGGVYNLQYTAKEGSEGLVTSVSTQTFTVTPPSVSVAKTLTHKNAVTPAVGLYTINDNLTYNIAITNTGTSSISSLPLQDLFNSSCLQFSSASPTQSSIAGGNISWTNLGTLSASSTTNVTVNFKVIGNCNPASNTAKVEGALNANAYAAPTVSSTVSVTIDQPPVAVADQYCVSTISDLAVLANDSDPDGDMTTLTILSAPLAGTATVTINPDKTIHFVPGGSLVDNQTVSFTYQICDNASPTTYCATSTVTVFYSNTNNPPVLLNDAVQTTVDLPVTVAELSNDYDLDGSLDNTTLGISTPPVYGTASINANGTITYVPNPGFIGTDHLVYRICDNGCPSPIACSTATITFSVIYAEYVCKEGSNTLSVPAVSGATGYVWTLPVGASGSSTTNTITVNWTGVTPGTYNVCVKPSNDCGPGTEQCVKVVVNQIMWIMV